MESEAVAPFEVQQDIIHPLEFKPSLTEKVK